MAVRRIVKHGRIALKQPVSDWLDQIEANGVAIIPVSRSIAERAVSLPEHHKDLVDRINHRHGYRASNATG